MSDSNSQLALSSQLFTNSMNMAFAAGTANADRNFTREMYAKQRADNLADVADARAYYRQMLDDERAYNSSAAQVERLKAAGLNPALAYGGQVTTAAPSGSFSSDKPTPAAVGSFHSPVPTLSDPSAAISAAAAARNSKTNQFLSRADALLKLAQSNLIDKESIGQELDNLYQSASMQDKLDLLSEDINLARAQVINTHFNSANLSAELDLFELRAKKLATEVDNISADTSLTPERRQQLIASSFESFSRTELNRINSTVAKVEKEIKDQNLDKVTYENSMKEITYWKDFSLDCLDGVGGLVDSFTGGIFKGVKSLFTTKSINIDEYNAESRRMDAVTNRQRMLNDAARTPSGSPNPRSRKRNR